jgi:hypothetical protein
MIIRKNLKQQKEIKLLFCSAISLKLTENRLTFVLGTPLPLLFKIQTISNCQTTLQTSLLFSEIKHQVLFIIHYFYPNKKSYV